MNKYEEQYRELEEAYKEVMDYISHDDPSKEKKRAMYFLKDTFLEINAKVEENEKLREKVNQIENELTNLKKGRKLDWSFSNGAEFKILREDDYKELERKSEALDKALDLIKQKRENAKLDLDSNYNTVNKFDRKLSLTVFEIMECREATKRIEALKNQIDTYADCIATIEAELGRVRE